MIGARLPVNYFDFQNVIEVYFFVTDFYEPIDYILRENRSLEVDIVSLRVEFYSYIRVGLHPP